MSSQQTMRAVVVKQPGSAKGLKIDTVPRPVPKDDEILVKIHSFALNRMDILQRDGHYPVPKSAPEYLGVEFAGVVEECGKDAKKYKKGERIFGLVYGGAYAEYTTIIESLAIPIPPELSFEQATAIPEVWYTAYQALFFVNNLQKGEDVLIHAGASAVGIAAIQLAKKAGANKIITTAGHDSKLTFCKSLGATHAINYKTASFRTSVSEITEKKGVNCIVDFIGAPYWTDNIDCLATDGRMCLLAFMGGNVVEKFDLRNLLIKRLKIEGSTLRSRSPEYQARLRDRIVEEVLPGLVGGELKLVVDRVFGWEDVVEAHEYMESNQSMGKIVLNVVRD